MCLNPSVSTLQYPFLLMYLLFSALEIRHAERRLMNCIKAHMKRDGPLSCHDIGKRCQYMLSEQSMRFVKTNYGGLKVFFVFNGFLFAQLVLLSLFFSLMR